MNDIKVEETFYPNGNPRTLRHLTGENKEPILEKTWHDNGQLNQENTYREGVRTAKNYDENGNLYYESKGKKYIIQGVTRFIDLSSTTYYINGQIAMQSEGTKNINYFDEEGNSITESEYKSSSFYKTFINNF